MSVFPAILIELHYLPSIQFWSKFFGYSQMIIEQHEHYTKRSYRNRCHIAGVNGSMRLTIPLQKGKNEQQPIREVKIASHENWQRYHWASICSAYGNAPFFDFYRDDLEVFYQSRYHFLFDFNWAVLQYFMETLQIDTSLTLSSTYQKTSTQALDFRNHISPKNHWDTDETFLIQKYPQVFLEKNGFLANLSILDLLFCAGPQANLLLEKSFK